MPQEKLRSADRDNYAVFTGWRPLRVLLLKLSQKLRINGTKVIVPEYNRRRSSNDR